jgi:hypothetical protein
LDLGIDKPLTELTQDDFDIFLIYMEDERNIKKGGIKVYIVFLKKFSKWALEDTPKWIRELKSPLLKPESNLLISLTKMNLMRFLTM